MHGLAPYAVRSLRARPARTGLTLAGIALGVAVLLAGLATNGGIEASIDRTVALLVGRADLRVEAFTEQGLSAATVTAIEQTPGVAVVAPAITRRTYLTPTVGRPALAPPVDVVGIDPAVESRVRDLVLSRGSPLLDADEAVALVTERLAREDGIDLGADLTLLGVGEPVRVRVVGVLEGDGPVIGSVGRTVIVPILTADRLQSRSAGADDDSGPPPLQGTPDGASPPAEPSAASTAPDPATPGAAGAIPATGISRVDVILASGADPAAVVDAIEAALVYEPYILERPADVAAGLHASTSDFRATTGLLAAVALFAGAFLIANTLAMTVVERIRELGLLRAAGATRVQILRLVTVQALVLGIAGSLVGIAGGALLSLAIVSSLRTIGSVPVDRPDLSVAVLAIAFAAGLAVTVLAAIDPARRAAAVSPVEALRVRGAGRGRVATRILWLVAVLVLVALVGSFTLPAGTPPEGSGRSLAVYALLLAAVLAAPVLLVPLGRVAGLLFRPLLRLEERLARAAIARDPGRSSITVGALIVGLAMIVALGAVATNARGAATAWLDDVVPGDEVLSAIAPVPLDEASPEDDLEAIEGVLRASPIATFNLAYSGQRLAGAALVGSDLADDGRLRFVAGDRDRALAAIDAGGAAIVARGLAERLGLVLDDVLALPTSDGSLTELRVAGIVERSLPAGGGDAVIVGWPDAIASFGVRGADAFAIRYAPGAPAGARTAVETVATERALTVNPIDRVEGALTTALDRVFGLFDLLAFAALIVAALGIVNTLSMDVWERVREIGVLRATGMTRRQVWRVVMVEAGILGIVAVVVGIVAGLGVGALLIVTAGGSVRGVPFELPWPTLAIAVVLGVGLAMVAAAWPARIASRIAIAQAVRSE